MSAYAGRTSSSMPVRPAATVKLMAPGQPTVRGNRKRPIFQNSRMGACDAFADADITAEQRHWIASQPERLWLSDDVFFIPGSGQEYLPEVITPRQDDAAWLSGNTPASLIVSGTHGRRDHSRAAAGCL